MDQDTFKSLSLSAFCFLSNTGQNNFCIRMNSFRLEQSSQYTLKILKKST